MKHDAFLHFSDIGDRTQQLQEMIGEDVEEDEDTYTASGVALSPGRNGSSRPIPKLRKGQDILVQITKEPVANKGVRVTSSISLPGAGFGALQPFDNKIGVSKKITDYREKKRLRYIARG